MRTLKFLSSWIVSWFTPVVVPIWSSPKYKNRFATVLSRGKITLVPLIMGAAFVVLQTSSTALIAAAAGTTTIPLQEVPAHETQGTFSLERVTVTFPSAVTGNSLGTLNIRQMRAGAQVSASIANLLLATGTTYNAETPYPFTITGNPNSLLAGDYLEVTYVQTGAGLALPANWDISAEID